MKTTIPLVLLAFLAVGCGANNPQTNTFLNYKLTKGVKSASKTNALLDSKLTKGAKELAQSNNEFADAVYKIISKEYNDGNLFFSAFSIHQALGMTYVGAEGETAKELLKGLSIKGQPSRIEFGKNYYNLTGEILKSQTENNKIYLANSYWIDEQIEVKKNYLNFLTKYFSVPAYSVDLQNTADLKKINDWVKTQTNGKIAEMVNEENIDKFLVTVLLNAIYFKSDWFYQFKVKKTLEEDFTLWDAKKVKTQMMNQRAYYNYGEDAEVQVLEMKYEAGNFSMVVVLPRASVSLTDIENKFDWEYLKSFIDSLKSEDVILKFPKFKLGFEKSMVEVLKKMGMADMFGGKADFTKISDAKGIFIGEVLHKTFIEVNEKSTEAATVSSGKYDKKSEKKNPPKPKEFYANRPFYFFIKENKTNAVLFTGRLMNPMEE